ncbi:MAG: DUF1653 domain-containing protein [Lachnospiraceae bacterium]|nr:DUF1653 domain-containing protein [Lachnospiraceae bacterium]
MPQSNPRAGEVYRHFKGKMYRVQGIATHSETGEALVLYQGLDGDYVLYARPYESFIEELDPKKYEGVTVKYRFTFIPMDNEFAASPSSMGNVSSNKNTNSSATSDETSGSNQVREDDHINDDKLSEREQHDSPMLKFLDTDDFDEKYEILCGIREADIDDVLIDNLAVTLDVVIPDGPIEQRFAELKTCVRTRKKYESIRLR